MVKREDLTTVVTSATAAVIALSGSALYLVQQGSHLWPMILASSCATLLVMSMLHSELQRLYKMLAAREDQSHREARIDGLTGLANRKQLIETLEHSLADTSQCSGLILIDLDQFKRVNDSRGHHAGDELLIAIANRLRVMVPEACAARLGGDEFAVFIRISDESELVQVCERLVTIFDEPFALSHGECFARGSIGAAALDAELDASQMLRRADVALYRAKASKSRIRIFDGDMIEAVERRARLAQDLRRIAKTGQGLSAVYQPIVARDGKIVALEALLRWRHPDLGKIAPEETVSVAEEVQLINELGLFVATQACQAAHALPKLGICINASAVQLLDSRFADRLVSMVRDEGVEPQRIQLELKEADLSTRAHEMSEAFDRLRGAGFSIAVDDFGSSNSSLAHLRRLGVTILKLDPSVLKNARELQNIAIMRAKIELAKALGMVVIAEGVSGEADRAAALQAGCDRMQGYLFGAPDELEVIVNKARRLRAA
jgi:diguanylate cyclase (GGDEF)-like protein